MYETLLKNLKVHQEINLNISLRVKYDINSYNLNLSHVAILFKLRKFQDYGHKIIITGENYPSDTKKILECSQVEVHNPKEWKVNLVELLHQAEITNIHQVVCFEKSLYPLLQAYGSVETKADVEIGTTTQLATLMLGSDLQRNFGQKPQTAITMAVPIGLNKIPISNPKEIYFRVRSIPNNYMEKWWNVLPVDNMTWEDAVAAYDKDTALIKHTLASRIIRFFYDGETAADVADEVYREVIPEKAFHAVGNGIPIGKLLIYCGFARNDEEVNKLLEKEVAISNEKRIKDSRQNVLVNDTSILRIGKNKTRLRIVRDDRAS